MNLMAETPTFVFDEDGKAYAYLDGKVIASANDVDELEQKLAYGAPNAGSGALDPNYMDLGGSQGGAEFDPSMGAQPNEQGCDTCGNPELGPTDQFCAQCGTPVGAPPEGADPADPGLAVDPLPQASPDTLPGDNLPPRATHVTTPNGLKGQILGKVKGVWGDQVTIRLENGRIAKFDVSPETDLSFTNERVAASSPLDSLQTRLDEMPDGTKSSLTARIKELKSIKNDASALFRSASAIDESAVHNLVVQADYELRETTDALAALEDAEPYAAPAPFDTGVVEQESLGGGASTWLDDTLGQMIEEAEATDFDQMMEEEPDTLVAEMETPALEDAAGVQEYALAHVNSKTAGLEREAVADFKAEFLRRVEAARLAELTQRWGGVLPTGGDDEAVRAAMSAIKREYLTSKTPEAEAKYEAAKKEFDAWQAGGHTAKTASTEDFDGPAEGLFY